MTSYVLGDCKIELEKYPVDGIECNCERGKYDQAKEEIENFKKIQTETNLLEQFIDIKMSRTNYNFTCENCTNKWMFSHSN